MPFLIALIFTALLVGIIAIIKPTLQDVEYFILLFKKKENYKTHAKAKKKNYLNRLRRIQEMLKATQSENKLYLYIAVSLILAGVGVVLGVSFDNYFLSPILAVGCASIPVIYIESQYIKYNKIVINELEPTLSTITVSYERTENILQSIEENLENINDPIRSIFEEFIYTIKFVNPSVQSAIDDMRHKIDNSVFREWCEALKRCDRDRNVKHMLQPIVNKLTKIKIAAEDAASKLKEYTHEYLLLLAISVFLLWFCVSVVPATLGIVLGKTTTNIAVSANITLMYITLIKVMYESKTIKFDL